MIESRSTQQTVTVTVKRLVEVRRNRHIEYTAHFFRNHRKYSKCMTCEKFGHENDTSYCSFPFPKCSFT